MICIQLINNRYKYFVNVSKLNYQIFINVKQLEYIFIAYLIRII